MLSNALPSILTCILVLASAACANTVQDPQTLQRAYHDAFKIGVAVNEDIIFCHDKVLCNIVKEQFNSITPENVMKAEVINPEPGRYDFSAADAVVEFAKTNSMQVIGHTLVWHNQTPAWFFSDSSGKPNSVEQQTQHMQSYIEKVAGRYATTIDAWDVVNEVIGDDGNYRDTSWVKAMGGGDNLVRKAFAFAQQYAPQAKLYYNDFNAWRPAKVQGIVKMVKMLQKNNIRIDGIGIQGHWGLNYPDLEDIQNAIDAYAALGLEVMITELDMDVLPLTKEGQIIGTGMLHPQYQNKEFRRFLDPYSEGLPDEIMAEYEQRMLELFALFYRNRDKISRITFWGVHDAMSWKNDYPIAARTNYPLLYDRKKNPKPIVNKLIELPQQ